MLREKSFILQTEELQNFQLKFHNPIDIDPKALEVCYSE